MILILFSHAEKAKMRFGNRNAGTEIFPRERKREQKYFLGNGNTGTGTEKFLPGTGTGNGNREKLFPQDSSVGHTLSPSPSVERHVCVCVCVCTRGCVFSPSPSPIYLSIYLRVYSFVSKIPVIISLEYVMY